MAKEKGALAARLRELRAERGLTQKTAAEHIGVASGTLGALERDKQRPSAPTLAKLAAGYGVPEGELEEARREDDLRPYKELPENWKRFTEDMRKLERPQEPGGVGGVSGAGPSACGEPQADGAQIVPPTGPGLSSSEPYNAYWPRLSFHHSQRGLFAGSLSSCCILEEDQHHQDQPRPPLSASPGGTPSSSPARSICRMRPGVSLRIRAACSTL
jgi:transcriptional regulator with XRE-family HTH domain